MAVSPNQHLLMLSLGKQSLWTANQIYQGYARGLPISETTITEINLVAIAQDTANANFLTTTLLNESQTGADWQWTIAGHTILCQAKIMDLATGTYPQLPHRVGFNGPLQVDVLLQYAQTQNAEAYYVLYNSGIPQNGVFSESDCGCFTVKASDMKGQISKFVNATRIGDTSLSWAEIKPLASPWQKDLPRFA